MLKANTPASVLNDHVNYGQSTNDVIPTAIRIGGLLGVRAFAVSGIGRGDRNR